MYILRIESGVGKADAVRLSAHPNRQAAEASLADYVGADPGPRDPIRAAIEHLGFVGPEPFETIAKLHGLIRSFVTERQESIRSEPWYEDLDDDTRDRIGHVQWFLDEADRVVSAHGPIMTDGR